MSHDSKSWLCTLRPQPHPESGGASDGVIEGWGNIGYADVLRDPEAIVIGAAEDKEDTSGSSTQMPVGASEPPQPSKAEVARQNLTRINYRTWCPHCVMARRPAERHKSNPTPKTQRFFFVRRLLACPRFIGQGARYSPCRSTLSQSITLCHRH